MSPSVRVIDSGGTDATFQPYAAGFLGGVRVALGDVTGDCVLDIITAAGPGGGPHVRVWNGTDLTEVGGFFAYSPAFSGGVFVAAGDVTDTRTPLRSRTTSGPIRTLMARPLGTSAA